MIHKFSKKDFHSICDELAVQDKDLAGIIQAYGYPPMWTRPNSFETVVHIILEQQVSLASALAALNKLREYIGEITPEAVLKLSDEELKACYFSRQKALYTKHLATAILNGTVNLPSLAKKTDDTIREELNKLKGIGNWTIDVYLMFVLQRADIFPIGDLAAVNALKQVKQLPTSATRDDVMAVAEQWQPYRTVATMILWHHYLSIRMQKGKNKKVDPPIL